LAGDWLVIGDCLPPNNGLENGGLMVLQWWFNQQNGGLNGNLPGLVNSQFANLKMPIYSEFSHSTC